MGFANTICQRAAWHLMLLLPLLFAFTAAASEPNLILTGSPVYPPFSWQSHSNPQQVTGIGIELAETICGELGISVENHYAGPWKRVQNTAENGEVDMIAGLFVTKEREAYLDYIYPPFMMDESVIFTLKGHAVPLKNWHDAASKVGGGLLGDASITAFEAKVRSQFPDQKFQVEHVATVEQLFKKLEYGRNDYIIYGLHAGLAYAQREGVRDKIDYISAGLPKHGMYLAFAKKSAFRSYKAAFSQKIIAYKANGYIDALIKKYETKWQQESGPK